MNHMIEAATKCMMVLNDKDIGSVSARLMIASKLIHSALSIPIKERVIH